MQKDGQTTLDRNATREVILSNCHIHSQVRRTKKVLQNIAMWCCLLLYIFFCACKIVQLICCSECPIMLNCTSVSNMFQFKIEADLRQKDSKPDNLAWQDERTDKRRKGEKTTGWSLARTMVQCGSEQRHSGTLKSLGVGE